MPEGLEVPTESMQNKLFRLLGLARVPVNAVTKPLSDGNAMVYLVDPNREMQQVRLIVMPKALLDWLENRRG